MRIGSDISTLCSQRFNKFFKLTAAKFKTLHHCPLCGECFERLAYSPDKRPVMLKAFPWDDAIIYSSPINIEGTVYPKKYAHGFCFAVLCCGYTLTDVPISIRLTSLALWQFNDCRSASKATLMNMDKYLMWIHYERLHNHNKAKHNKTLCISWDILYH